MGGTGFRNTALAVLAATVVFSVATYDHYRGSVYSTFHGGPVSAAKHHITLADATLLPNGGLHFHAYLDGGTPAVPSNIMEATLLRADGSVAAKWDGTAISQLPPSAIHNDFAYNRFGHGAFSLSAKMGAKATLTLPPQVLTEGVRTLRLRTANGGVLTPGVTAGS